MSEPTLSLREVRVRLAAHPDLSAVNGIDLAVDAGETVALVGESGCGKSVTAHACLGLLPPALVASGGMWLDGREYDLADRESTRSLRGRDVAMVFQDPGSALNPVMRVGRQIAEVLRPRQKGGRQRARTAVELLEQVGVPAPDRVARAYPFELSGGMQQRVLIAMALACRPRLLIADEPTTALDATVQAQIMELLSGLARDEGMALLFISHDLGLVAQYCQRAYVMYAGRIVESGRVDDVLSRPRHPYTTALVECLASMAEGSRRLRTVPGSVPGLHDMPTGCRFAPRCAHAIDACTHGDPPELRPAGQTQSACIRADELAVTTTTAERDR